MSISLKDIAKELNISTTTVSWVLSGQGEQKRISEATCKKILDYAERHNYHPNLLARGLNTGMTGTIWLILPSISDSFYSQVAKTIELEAENYGYTLMICSSESEIERENRMIQMFKAKHVDGIIIAPTKYSQTQIELLMKESYPFVLFDRFFDNLKTNYILINNEECSHDLTMSLVREGRKKIAILLTNPYLKIMNMRYSGYKRALEEGGLVFDEHLYGTAEFSSLDVQISTMLDRIFSEVPDVDGFFFATHVMAMDTFTYMSERHIDIRKFGYACIHEVNAFRLIVPNIKFAKMPVEEIGKNAVRIIYNNIMAKRKKVMLPVESLVIKCEMCNNKK